MQRALSVSKKYFRPAVRILKLSKSFKILLIERAVGFLPPAHTPRCSVPDIFCEVFCGSVAELKNSATGFSAHRDNQEGKYREI